MIITSKKIKPAMSLLTMVKSLTPSPISLNRSTWLSLNCPLKTTLAFPIEEIIQVIINWLTFCIYAKRVVRVARHIYFRIRFLKQGTKHNYKNVSSSLPHPPTFIVDGNCFEKLTVSPFSAFAEHCLSASLQFIVVLKDK